MDKIIYEFEVAETITGKSRPRMNTRTGRAYTPTKTKDYEYFVRENFVMKYRHFTPIDGRVRVNIIAYFEIPKSAKKTDIPKMINNEIAPTKKPDFDNIAKIVIDALNRFAFKDDAQITEATIIKKYAETPKVLIKIEEI